MFSKILGVIEYHEEGFAIFEDLKGKFIMTSKDSQLIPLDTVVV